MLFEQQSGKYSNHEGCDPRDTQTMSGAKSILSDSLTQDIMNMHYSERFFSLSTIIKVVILLSSIIRKASAASISLLIVLLLDVMT